MSLMSLATGSATQMMNPGPTLIIITTWISGWTCGTRAAIDLNVTDQTTKIIQTYHCAMGSASMVMVSGCGKSITTPQEGTTKGCFFVWNVRSRNSQRSILQSHS